MIITQPLEFKHPIYNVLKPHLDKYGGIIAGGAARQIFLAQRGINRENDNFGDTDIDIYFLSSAFYRNKFCRVLNNFAKRSYEYDSGSGAQAETFIYNDVKIQVMNRCYANSEELFNGFDFTCCQFAIECNTIKYIEQAAEDTVNKVLTYNLGCMRTSNHRLVKYVLMKGYTPIGECQTLFDKYFKYALNSKWLDVEQWAGIKKPFDIGEGLMRRYNDVPNLNAAAQYYQGMQNAQLLYQQLANANNLPNMRQVWDGPIERN